MTMRVFSSPPEVGKPAVLTLGSFDGLHVGHRQLIERTVERSRQLEARSMLVTFDPHPLTVVDPARAPAMILNRQQKFARLESLGLDDVFEIRFNREVSLLSPREFVQSLILSTIDVREVIIGYDHHFGRGRSGSARSLAEFGEERGFGVEVIAPVRVGGAIVSCTRIRAAIRAGRMREARELLENPFALSGVVDRGDGRGQRLGFPTANISLTSAERLKVQPAPGVYAVLVHTPAGPFQGMLNYGIRPTFSGSKELRYEVHLLDFNQNVYGEHLTLSFMARIRDEKRFDGPAALRAQLEADREDCVRLLKHSGA